MKKDYPAASPAANKYASKSQDRRVALKAAARVARTASEKTGRPISSRAKELLTERETA